MSIGFSTDWFEIITQLERTGLSLKNIGDVVGRNPATIFRYKMGIEPRHCVGEMILHLFQSRCGTT